MNTLKTIPQQIIYRHALAKQLGLTYLQYENLRYEFYIDWCAHLIQQGKASHLKPLISHDSLMNWYDDQWYEEVEKTIERHYGTDITLFNADDVLLLITIYAENILQYYPSVLLKKITARTARTEH
ncbi:hypothetical protein ACSQ7D_00045 [Capnocytophaga sp. G1920]|uniref:hypothetical protein n=1 Tax=Capnocytophaga sp. G1920 TaxID=3448875 RepID=UPI003EDBB051